jgi:hypothetical protein
MGARGFKEPPRELSDGAIAPSQQLTHCARACCFRSQYIIIFSRETKISTTLSSSTLFLPQQGSRALGTTKYYPSSLFREVGFLYFNTFPSQ